MEVGAVGYGVRRYSRSDASDLLVRYSGNPRCHSPFLAYRETHIRFGID